MHVFDESTNIAANLHCLWLIFHQASWEDSFTMHSGKFLSSETKQVPDVAPLASNFRPRIFAKVGCTTFRNLMNCVRDSLLLEIVRNHC